LARSSLRLWALIALGGAAFLAMAQAPFPPVLRIDVGDHASLVLGLAVSGDGTRLATASYDQTIRVWTMPGLQPFRTIRMPVGPNLHGIVYTAAFVPDGKTLATSGRTGDWEKANTGPWCIYIVDVDGGDIRRTVCDLPAQANRLTYSPDGAYLAVVMRCETLVAQTERCSRGGGLRVYRTADYSLFARDTDYGDSTTWLEFHAGGGLVTASLDGKIRVYDRDFKLTASRDKPDGRRPRTASFSPDGTRIAVAYAEPEEGEQWTPAVDVLSATDLATLYRPDVRGVTNGALWRVAWSADGESLYAGGTWQRGNRYPLRRWSEGGRGRPRDVITSPDHIAEIRRVPGGAVAFIADTAYMAVVGAEDRVMAERRPPKADFKLIGDRLGVTRGGTAVEFGFEHGGGRPAHFSLAERRLEPGEIPAGTEVARPLTEAPGLDVRDWADSSYRPTLNGARLPLRVHESSNSLAIAPTSKRSFLLGTERRIYHFDAKGGVIWQTEVPGVVQGVVIDADERIAVAAVSDGTLRWYAMDSGNELLALYAHPDRQRWVAWTRSGYYMASVEGDSLIGWQVNRGRDRAGDYFPVSTFRDIYYRPDVVSKVLATLDEETAIRRADGESGRPPRDRALASLLPPVVTVRSPANGTAVDSPRVQVSYELRATSSEPIRAVEVRANGRPLAVIERGRDAPLTERGTIEVYVPRQDVTLEVVAQTASGIWSAAGTARLRWTGTKTEDDPALYVLAVGVSEYQEAALSLKYADKDARDFVALLRDQKGRRYRQVTVNEPMLQNRGARIEAIRAGLRWLEANTTGRDVAMVFLAGHGTADPAGQYFFLPHEATAANVFERGLSYDEIRAALARIPGKVFLFIDTCRAGAVGNVFPPADMTRIVNDLRNTEYSVVVFASSTGVQESMESAEWQNGAFTKALIAGLSGKAPQHDGYVTTLGLSFFLSTEVPRLTGERRQQPMFGQPVSADFNLVKVPK
jgi:WD40 repeat protein